MKRENPPIEAVLHEERLDTWKEVAAYLQRDVSTVKRWEKRESLPVHRHVHEKQGRVYAYRSEIDAWLRLRSEQPPKNPSRSNLSWIGLQVALLAVAASSFLLWILWPPTASSDLELARKPRVLVANFENSSGDELFDATLKQAISVALSESGRVSVATPQSVADVLRLMKLPADRPLDLSLARQISQRDGAVDAVIAGSVDQADQALLVTVSLYDPLTASIEASRVVKIGAAENVLESIGELSEWIGECLDSPPHPQLARERLEKATTPSLRALRLYSKAMELGYREEWGSAEPLLRSAVKEDPDFASAHIMLAWALRNQIHPLERPRRRDEYLPAARRAFDLSDSASAAERLWISGSYYSFAGDFEKSARLYGALVSLRNDHYWGANNLAFHYRNRVRHGAVPGSFEKAVTTEKRRADLRRRDFWTNYMAAYRLGIVFSDLAGAEPYRKLALEVLPADESGVSRFDEAFLRLMPPFAELLSGNPESALQALERMEAQSEGPVAPWLADYYLSLGMLDKAGSLTRSEVNPTHRLWEEAVIAYASGDRAGFQRAMRRFWEHSQGFEGPMKPMLLARAGLIEEANQLLDEVGPQVPLGATADLMDAVRGTVALLAGDESGVDLLESALGCPATYGTFLLGAEVLAEHHQGQGRTMEAIGVLERAHSRTHATLFQGNFYGLIQARLLRLLRETDRLQEAAELENRMRSRWAFADSDHPVLAALDEKPSAGDRPEPGPYEASR